MQFDQAADCSFDVFSNSGIVWLAIRVVFADTLWSSVLGVQAPMWRLSVVEGPWLWRPLATVV